MKAVATKMHAREILRMTWRLRPKKEYEGGANKLLAVMITTLIEIVKADFIFSLLIVYAKNCQRTGSKFSLGLFAFAMLMLIETIIAICLYPTTNMCRVAQIYGIVRPVLSAIECVSFAALAWLSWS